MRKSPCHFPALYRKVRGADAQPSTVTALPENSLFGCCKWSKRLPCVCASPGSGSLKIDFVGELNDKMKGFYRSKYTTPAGEIRYAAVTQFEVNRCLRQNVFIRESAATCSTHYSPALQHSGLQWSCDCCLWFRVVPQIRQHLHSIFKYVLKTRPCVCVSVFGLSVRLLQDEATEQIHWLFTLCG